jgi:hypothetical protein
MPEISVGKAVTGSTAVAASSTRSFENISGFGEVAFLCW